MTLVAKIIDLAHRMPTQNSFVRMEVGLTGTDDVGTVAMPAAAFSNFSGSTVLAEIASEIPHECLPFVVSVQDGQTMTLGGLSVPPGDAAALRTTMEDLAEIAAVLKDDVPGEENTYAVGTRKNSLNVNDRLATLNASSHLELGLKTMATIIPGFSRMPVDEIRSRLEDREQKIIARAIDTWVEVDLTSELKMLPEAISLKREDEFPSFEI